MNASKKDIIAQLPNQKDKAIKPFFITRFIRTLFFVLCAFFGYVPALNGAQNQRSDINWMRILTIVNLTAILLWILHALR